MIWRLLYPLMGFLLMPVLVLRLYWRGRKNPGYRQHIGERFGWYRMAEQQGAIWIHAVSVGETRAAVPLVAQLEKQYPGVPIVLTHMTATGRATGGSLFGGRVIQAWLPYDYRFAVRRFLRHFTPRLALLMETEVWPNAIDECRRRNIPCFLINARMSERSAKKYAFFSSFTRPVFAALTGVSAQTADDGARLAALGADNVTVTGNLKFDMTVPGQMRELAEIFRQRFNGGADAGASRPVWVIASTRDGEEALILDAWQSQKHRLPEGTLTVIVPRHPERFDTVASLLSERNLGFVRRSENGNVPMETDFVLGDSMGELFAYYAAADVAFVGGSLLPFGGQNLLEPISVGTPALIGPHTFNFKEISAAAGKKDAILRVTDADDLIVQAGGLLSDPTRREAMKKTGADFLSEHRGATEKLIHWLAQQTN